MMIIPNTLSLHLNLPTNNKSCSRLNIGRELPFYGLSTAHGRARGAFALSARLWAAFSCQLVFFFSVREKSVIMEI